jgi:N-acetylmuramic acid 6-phosphate (MurNAc-6-P) etherase
MVIDRRSLKPESEMSKQTAIRIVMEAAKCDSQTANSYLEAEEWNIEQALISLKGDRE